MSSEQTDWKCKDQGFQPNATHCNVSGVVSHRTLSVAWPLAENYNIPAGKPEQVWQVSG